MSLGASGVGAPPQAQAAGAGGNTFSNYASGGATGNVGTPPAELSNQGIAPPAAAFSPYEYQDVSAASITLGPQLASLLNLSATVPQTGADVMQAFLDASSSSLTALENSLYAAGMYTSAAGQQPDAGIVTGQMDNNAFEAMSQAILMVNNTHGETLSSYLAQQQLSGAGQARIEKALQPITGGGATYQVNLTSPTDVYATAMQIFQQYLGRNPTQSEIQSITGQVQGQEKQYQTAQNTQAETAKQGQYQQAINSRTAVQSPYNAAAAGSGVPTGPFDTPGQYAVALLQYLGFQPTTNNVSLLVSWIAKNGGMNKLGQNNPLGVQGSGAGTTPSKGATNFPTMAGSIQATANLLASPQYQALYGVLGAGNKPLDAAAQKAVNAEIGQWSNGKVKTVSPKAATAAAQTAIQEYQLQHTQQALGQNYAQPGMSGNNRQIGGLQSGAQNNAVGQTLQAGATNPQVGAYLQAGYAAQHPSASPNTAPPGQTGSQGLASPGDSYLPANTLTDITPPSASAVATTAATTGANAVPYLGQQFLDAYQTILNAITTPPKA